MTRNGILRAAAFAAAVLMLAACGGGGSPAPVTQTPPVLSAQDEARLARLGALRGRADTLRMTGLHVRWSLSAEGEADITDVPPVGVVTCAGARCVAAGGEEITARDLLDLSGTGSGAAALAERGGFDTVRTTDGFAVTETVTGLALTVSPQATTWGFWGAHGFAALTLGAGSLAAEVSGTAFEGSFSSAQAWAAGASSGSNPAGTGSAVWTGIAEASPTGTFGRVPGTATLTIADLSQPRVDVDIALEGVDAPLRWTDMPLADGRFGTGTAGSTDYLEGSFHGPAHEEAWGVFDTQPYLGAFGAKRSP